LGPSLEGHRILQPRDLWHARAWGPWRDGRADHLRVIEVQSITRKRAKEAAREEVPTESQISGENLIKAAQEEDGYAQRIMRELTNQKGPPSYSRSEDGLLLYKRKLYVPNQRSLIGELMSMYHDDPHAGHWGVDKTLELLKRKFC
jgi:Integrase zinc binding domain